MESKAEETAPAEQRSAAAGVPERVEINSALIWPRTIRAREGTPESKRQSRIEGAKLQAEGLLEDPRLSDEERRDRILTMVSNFYYKAHEPEVAAAAVAAFANKASQDEIMPWDRFAKQGKKFLPGQEEQLRERAVEIAKELATEAGLPDDFLIEHRVLIPARWKKR